tara:strand:- start:251 stop:526 length:276 start_codon:yes stop_codon:yes gene_type:complete
MNREELGEVVAIMLDTMPNNISEKDIAIIIVNFIINKKMANHWPIINECIENGLVDFLVSQAVENDMNGQLIQDAVQDADDFLEGIVNGAG